MAQMYVNNVNKLNSITFFSEKETQQNDLRQKWGIEVVPRLVLAHGREGGKLPIG